jgi:hypothetical protein
MGNNGLDQRQIQQTVSQVFAWSRNQGYRGYNKHDGLNSPILRLLLGWGKWPRIVAIQGVMRLPINIRPLLGIPKTYNPKGLALFVQALLHQYQATGEKKHLAEAEQILDILLTIRSPGEWSGICWGYHYPWQDPGFFAPTNTPNAVVTCFVCEAFLDAYRITGNSRYLETVGDAISFFLNDLTILKNEPDELCFSYMPLPMTMRVMDVSILISSVIAQWGSLARDNTHAESANRLINYVVGQQTNAGAWFYTDPPGDSHIRHDNYHTGFILDAIWRYMHATNDFQWKDSYDKGLKFYAEQLFNADGSPRWMSDCDYPHDIHGAAQGIITFSRHHKEYPLLADKIAKWALENMYHTGGRFYYQQQRYFTKRFTLLRWCNSWMARGLTALAVSHMAHNQ